MRGNTDLREPSEAVRLPGALQPPSRARRHSDQRLETSAGPGAGRVDDLVPVHAADVHVADGLVVTADGALGAGRITGFHAGHDLGVGVDYGLAVRSGVGLTVRGHHLVDG